jgi:lipopolysaccharide exporter
MTTATEPSPRIPVIEELPHTVRRGFKWSFAATLCQGALQVGVTMTMARLLLPAEYGVYAMVDVVLRWASLMAQMGLATVLVQKMELTDTDLRSAHTLALGLALAASLTVAGGAPILALWFGTNEIVPLLQVASLSFVINGLGLTSLAVLRRRMQFGRLGVADLTGFALGNGLTGIYLASHGAGVWSVVIGSLTGQLVQNAVAIVQARLPFGFSLQLQAVRPLLRQGAHVSVNTCLDITNNTMDTFVIGRVMPHAIVGLFNRSAMLATLPAAFLWNAVSRVAFPSYSRLQHAPRDFTALLRNVRSWSGTLCVAVPLGMIPAADVIVQFLLGPAWTNAIPIVRLLLLGVAFDSLAFPYHNALDALGCYAERTKIRLVIFLLRGSCLAAFAAFRVDWLFCVASIAAASTWVISIRPVARKLNEPVRRFFAEDARILLHAFACAVAVVCARYFGAVIHAAPTTILLISIVSGGTALALVLRPYLPHFRASR